MEAAFFSSRSDGAFIFARTNLSLFYRFEDLLERGTEGFLNLVLRALYVWAVFTLLRIDDAAGVLTYSYTSYYCISV